MQGEILSFRCGRKTHAIGCEDWVLSPQAYVSDTKRDSNQGPHWGERYPRRFCPPMVNYAQTSSDSALFWNILLQPMLIFHFGERFFRGPISLVSHAIMSHMQYYPENIIACNNVCRAVLHMQSCPHGRCCIMQLCPPGHICICSCVRPVQNRPCSKLIALGRRNKFAIILQAKCMSWMTWEMFGRLVFAAIIKYVNIHAAYT